MKTFALLLCFIGSVIAQTDKDIDTLLSEIYDSQLHVECYPVTLFPYFAADGPQPPLERQAQEVGREVQLFQVL
jgi:hypothetical protein